MLTPVFDAKAVRTHGTVYVGGGVPYGNGMEVFRLDREHDQWERVANLPAPRTSYALVAYRDSLYVIGGTTFVPGEGQVPQASMFAYSIDRDWWVDGVPMPEGRTNHAATVVNDRIVVIGGVGEAGPAAVVSIYDPTTGHWSDGAPLPTQRMNPKIEMINGSIYVFGGWKPDREAIASELDLIEAVEVYDLSTDSWRTVTTLPSHRLRFSTVTVGSEVHVFGGYDPTPYPARTTIVEPTSRYEVYDTVTDTWVTGTSGMTPRYGMAAVLSGDVLMAIGGVQWVTPTDLVELTMPGR